jgi:hypothetical protein
VFWSVFVGEAEVLFMQQIDFLVSWSLFATALYAAIHLWMKQTDRFWSGANARYDLAALGLVTLFVIIGIFVFEPTRLHCHLTFMKRTDCAQLIGKCDLDEGVWGTPTFHVMGLLLQLIPYRLDHVLGLGVVLTGICLLLVYVFTVKLAENMGFNSSSRQVGLWAVAILVMHPGIHRLAGAGTFWPLTMCFLFGGGALFLESRKSASALEYISAGALFALAMGGQRIMLALTPLAFLAPWCWPTSIKRSRYYALCAAMPIFYCVTRSVGAMLSPNTPSYGLLRILDSAWHSVVDDTWFDLTFMMWPVAILVVGSFFVVSSHRRQLLPLLYALIAIATILLGILGPASWVGDPGNYIEQFPVVLLGATPAAIAFVSLLRRQPIHLQPVAAVGFAILLAGAAATRQDALDLLRASRVMEREIKVISQAMTTLPPHDTLLIQQRSEPPKGIDSDGDPIVVYFPLGEYRWVLNKRGIIPAKNIQEPAWAIGKNQNDMGKTLLYVGSTLRSFYRGEIETGMVPVSFERPELVELRKHFRLTPVRTFRISTSQPLGPRELSKRAAADQLKDFEIGFYWVHPLPAQNRGKTSQSRLH